MKFHHSTKEQNRNWAYIYLGLASAMIYYGFKDRLIYFLFATVLIALAGWRLFYLSKKYN
jgi:hypothetical protein